MRRNASTESSRRRWVVCIPPPDAGCQQVCCEQVDSNPTEKKPYRQQDVHPEP